MLSGISTEATKAVDGAVHVSVIDNWYFMATSVVVLTIAGALLTDKFIEPRLPKGKGQRRRQNRSADPLQNRG